MTIINFLGGGRFFLPELIIDDSRDSRDSGIGIPGIMMSDVAEKLL